jgi:hypothetical protein
MPTEAARHICAANSPDECKFPGSILPDTRLYTVDDTSKSFTLTERAGSEHADNVTYQDALHLPALERKWAHQTVLERDDSARRPQRLPAMSAVCQLLGKARDVHSELEEREGQNHTDKVMATPPAGRVRSTPRAGNSCVDNYDMPRHNNNMTLTYRKVARTACMHIVCRTSAPVAGVEKVMLLGHMPRVV